MESSPLAPFASPNLSPFVGKEEKDKQKEEKEASTEGETTPTVQPILYETKAAAKDAQRDNKIEDLEAKIAEKDNEIADREKLIEEMAVISDSDQISHPEYSDEAVMADPFCYMEALLADKYKVLADLISKMEAEIIRQLDPIALRYAYILTLTMLEGDQIGSLTPHTSCH